MAPERQSATTPCVLVFALALDSPWNATDVVQTWRESGAVIKGEEYKSL